MMQVCLEVFIFLSLSQELRKDNAVLSASLVSTKDTCSRLERDAAEAKLSAKAAEKALVSSGQFRCNFLRGQLTVCCLWLCFPG